MQGLGQELRQMNNTGLVAQAMPQMLEVSLQTGDVQAFILRMGYQQVYVPDIQNDYYVLNGTQTAINLREAFIQALHRYLETPMHAQASLPFGG